MIYSIQRQISLKPYNTFGVDVSCQEFVDVVDEMQLFKLFEDGKLSQKFFVLGGGSNVLFTKDYDGMIIRIAIKGITHFIEGNYIYITAKGGEIWNDFVWYCVDRGFGGVENLVLIPGTVGASPVQNIGAYGTELMDIFYSCRAFDTVNGESITFRKEDCQFTYRDSIFKSAYKGRFVITSVTYRLPLHHSVNLSYGAIQTELQKRGITQPDIKDVAEVISAIRVEKLPDPSFIGNAGSFFKNPVIPLPQFNELRQLYPNIAFYPLDSNHVKIAAGWLIEQCGWKGKADGHVAVWKKQALVITNLGNASGEDLYSTSSKILNDVYKKFGILLEREVNIL